MILFLDLLASLSLALMIGSEFAVSAFVNPVLWQLEERSQSFAVKAFANKLGTLMPPWYGINLFFLITEALLRRNTPSAPILWVSITIWVLIILLTILFLVPINDRLGKMEESKPTAADKMAHRRWDRGHRIRIAALIVAFLLFVLALLKR